MKVLALALILAGCSVVPKSIINVVPTRAPFEFVAYGQKVDGGQMLQIAMETCNGASFTVTEYIRHLDQVTMYFNCKVGR